MYQQALDAAAMKQFKTLAPIIAVLFFSEDSMPRGSMHAQVLQILGNQQCLKAKVGWPSQ